MILDAKDLEEKEETEETATVEGPWNDELFDGGEQEADEADDDTPIPPAPAPVNPSVYTRLEQAHYEEIRKAEIEVGRLHDVAICKKEAAGAARKNFESADSELRAMIRRGPDLQMKLLPVDETDDTADTTADEAWKEIAIDTLGISPAIVSVLKEKNGIKTLGQLADWSESHNGFVGLVSIGVGKAAKITEACQAYWDSVSVPVKGGK